MTTTSAAALKGIVVGVDGSASSVEALRWAARMAAISDGPIHAVTAWRYPTGYGWGAPDWDPHQDARQILSDTVDKAFGEDKPTQLDLIVAEGNPARVLLECSADAELLVVGSRGHGGFTGLLLGSVSAQCAEHASCPVLVVHDPSASAEDSRTVRSA